ncbi:tumor protein p53-inducible nuclear protein 1 isoform X1 [Tachysurus fulvidraco]|uniref:tumor protein p53-inducible nuclear protein 1 isoform X1 n=1 Tax=Tachysurus fulvidraco TaxID=1234273 RepID=UPI000F4ED0AF|nr:tumor protein p53-inducible nuclear protein 1 isoform X1 [Tachysurus fulvidraco]XP_027005620.1 tumor protein p53-inducible nuclear protein 1 isoform X1 [Tachysurus fulvidraco]XP_027005621.1 tumor protein p53-inducible nuclear protein 1 isoform X1 [Tachysurus fulvidraco]XP_027005622.1 tumor protein p53-inducible nuclear protein 1 isoform X1 [Tachysurus fulvidraco]
MLQRFTSILFGDALEEATECPADVGFNRNEDDEDWILVDYLAEACSSACDEELIGVCSENMDAPDCPLRCNSCSSLDSAADTDPEDRGFLHLDAECGLEESWFITPPPCFTAGGRGPVLLETSPLENLLIEHPSMSVYAVHSSDHRQLKENSCEPSILRSDVQYRPSHPTGCYAAALTATRASFLEQAKNGRLAQRIRDNVQRQQLSRNALRRLNLLRDGGARQAKAAAGHVQQPGQRQYNY